MSLVSESWHWTFEEMIERLTIAMCLLAQEAARVRPGLLYSGRCDNNLVLWLTHWFAHSRPIQSPLSRRSARRVV